MSDVKKILLCLLAFTMRGSTLPPSNVKCVCVCVPVSTHCTIMCFRSRARRIDGVECGLFSIHAPLGQTTLRLGQVSV